MIDPGKLEELAGKAEAEKAFDAVSPHEENPFAGASKEYEQAKNEQEAADAARDDSSKAADQRRFVESYVRLKALRAEIPRLSGEQKEAEANFVAFKRTLLPDDIRAAQSIHGFNEAVHLTHGRAQAKLLQRPTRQEEIIAEYWSLFTKQTSLAEKIGSYQGEIASLLVAYPAVLK